MKYAVRTGTDVLTLFRKACVAHGSSFAKQVVSATDDGSLATFLKENAPVPASYACFETFATDWLLANLLKKSPLLPGLRKVDRERKAYSSWKAAEVACASTNRAIASLRRGSCALTGISVGERTNVAGIISDAQRKILSVIGDSPCVDSILARGRWSGGATALTPRGTSVGEKVSASPSVTRGAYRLAAYMMCEDYSWLRSLGIEAEGPCTPLDLNFEVIEWNRLEFVPKTAYTERAICAEPSLNAFMQQGVGRTFRRALKRVGVDLDDQSWNQRLAAIAEDAMLATLDLEAASDTVAYGLVELLLPEQWFTILNALRCDVTKHKDVYHRLNKFSAMGNAFTFELESLIFWAISESVVEATSASRLLAIYGDDIIVPQESAPALTLVLETLGFRLNREKSFFRGTFFESCGVHVFQKKTVTPVYSKTRLNHVSEVIRLYNSLVRWADRCFDSWSTPCTRPFLRALWIKDSFHTPWIDGDEGFITPLHSFAEDLQRGYRCKVLVAVATTEACSHEAGFLAYKLRRPTFSNADPRGFVAKSGERWVSKVTWIPHWRLDDAAIRQLIKSAPSSAP